MFPLTARNALALITGEFSLRLACNQSCCKNEDLYYQIEHEARKYFTNQQQMKNLIKPSGERIILS